MKKIAGVGLLLSSAGGLLLALSLHPAPADTPGAGMVPDGINPHPVQLRRPAVAPLSIMAQLGHDIFFDRSLSSSGQLACASCHDPDNHYGPPGDLSAVLGGPRMQSQGVRAVPSLMYLENLPNFSIGPDDETNENTTVAQAADASQGVAIAQKTAQSTATSATNMVPQGGLFWDGRSDTLQSQADFPLLNPLEMDGGSDQRVADKLKHAPYAKLFAQLFGSAIFDDPEEAAAEATFAVARYQIEAPSFHPYTSKYDYWLEGKARLTPQEMHGLALFNDPAKADCGGCHLDQPTPDGLPPVFTDHQFEALGVPRNPALVANRDPHYYDLGICGPYRTDLSDQTQYCAMFSTPTLRNVATRKVFFHNGIYHTLQQVLDFYDFRDTNPEKIYPLGPDGKPLKYNDIPAKYQANADVTDPPFDRKPGQTPAMTAQDEADIIAFLGTLTDGYKPDQAPHAEAATPPKP